VIQISPHTEPAQTLPGIPGAESQPQKSGSEKNGPGVFARILAGLLGKTTGTNAATETQNAVTAAETAEHGELGQLLEGGEHGFRAVNALAAGLTETAGAAGKAVEPDLPRTWFSEQDNDLGNLSAGFLPGLSGERAEQAGENAEPVYLAAAGSPGGSVHPALETAVAQTAETVTETAQSDPAAAKNLAAGTVAAQTRPLEPAETARSAGENAKAGIASAETAVAAGKTAADGLPARSVADKTAAADEVKTNAADASDEAGVKNRRRGSVAAAGDYRASGVQTENVYREGAANANAGETRIVSDGSGKDVLIEVRLPTQNGTSSATTVWETRSGQVLENMLARELHQHLNGDIVRQASIILREGTDGVIRLALRPESLGNVKIHLEMAENKITGYIVVESEEALRAFEKELASLEKEFRDSGFDGAELQMSLAEKGTEQKGNETEDGRFLPEHVAASRYDASAEMTETSPAGLYWQGSGTVDMLA